MFCTMCVCVCVGGGGAVVSSVLLSLLYLQSALLYVYSMPSCPCQPYPLPFTAPSACPHDLSTLCRRAHQAGAPPSSSSPFPVSPHPHPLRPLVPPPPRPPPHPPLVLLSLLPPHSQGSLGLGVAAVVVGVVLLALLAGPHHQPDRARDRRSSLGATEAVGAAAGRCAGRRQGQGHVGQARDLLVRGVQTNAGVHK
jgi:hypothetical protein